MYVRNAVDVFLFYARMYNWGEFLVSKNARIICEVGETNLGKWRQMMIQPTKREYELWKRYETAASKKEKEDILQELDKEHEKQKSDQRKW